MLLTLRRYVVSRLHFVSLAMIDDVLLGRCSRETGETERGEEEGYRGSTGEGSNGEVICFGPVQAIVVNFLYMR